MFLLIPAAGVGKRMGAKGNKLLLKLENKPLLAWTLINAEKSQEIEWIGIMGQPYDFEEFTQIIEQLSLTKPVTLIKRGRHETTISL